MIPSRLFSSFKPQRFLSTIAIRREDGVMWERRAPMSPAQVKTLLSENKDLKIIIQPSSQRVFDITEFESAGAVVSEDVSGADLIIGVKQVPVDQLYNDKTYLFFSHTIKAQEANMPILDACLDRNIKLLDYEKICKNGEGQRLVAFGKWAGVVGAVDILNALGIRMLALGYETPFLKIARAHNYTSVTACYDHLAGVVKSELPKLAPKLDSPLVTIFVGNGNVSKGAQEVFQKLGAEFIQPSDLEKTKQSGDKGKLYACVVDAHDHLSDASGNFNFSDFSKNPTAYTSNFASQFAKHANVIINGVVWLPGQPKLLTNEDLKQLPNLHAVADVSADPNGSLEFMKDCTSLDRPYRHFNAKTGEYSDNMTDKEGFVYCSVDNMARCEK